FMAANQPYRVALMLDLEWAHKRHTAVFAGTQEFAREQGWNSVIDEYADEELAATARGALPYDGVIGRASRKLAEQAERLELPVVNTWYNSPVWNRVPGVFADFEAAGRLVAEHLLGRGLRRFAAIGPRERSVKVAARGFRRAVHEAGFACVTDTHPARTAQTYANWQKVRRRIEAWMEDWEPPLGVHVGTEEVGRLVVQLCQRRGWRVPEDVAIVAGYNEPTLCEHPQPALTSVELGYERLGYEAARLLRGLMQAKRSSGERGRRSRRKSSTAVEHIYLPPRGIVIRESTDFVALQDEMVAAALQFISENAHRAITRDDVAEAVHAETRTLQNHFQRHLGRPIASEIRRVRIERAKRELSDGGRSLAEISEVVGFGPVARLHQVFRREVGMTPGEYRR
ncbi:MAG: substrate-binding domain-containing protein, partial [Pirellulales bacterium]